MGIREHFAGQPNQEDLKIHDLDPNAEIEKKSSFDPEEVFSDKDRQYVEKIAKDDLRNSALSVLADIKLFSPEWCQELLSDINLQSEIETHILDELIPKLETEQSDDYIDNYITYLKDYLQVLANYNSLFPDQKIEPIDQGYEQAMESLKIFRQAEMWLKFCEAAALIKRNYPSRAKNLGLDQETKQAAQERLNPNNIFQYAEHAANIRLLFPDSKIEDPDKLQQMKDFLERKTTTIYGKVLMIKFISILTAEKIQFTSDGIEIHNSKQGYKQDKKPRPERKTF